MIEEIDFRKAILNTWKTTNRITIFLIEHIPEDLWNEKVPRASKRTIGMIASHIHNTRCMWIKMIAKGLTIKMPVRVDPRHADRREVIRSLNQSSQIMLKLLKACFVNGGRLPTRPPWLNFPNDVVHFLAYFIAHEGHHRGQIILLTRQLNHQLPKKITDGLWQWKRRLKEAK